MSYSYLSLKILVSLSLWQLQEICATYSTLTMHSLRPFAFLTQVWPSTPLGDILCLIKKNKSHCRSEWSEGIPACIKGKPHIWQSGTYFFSKKLPFQQAAEDSIWTTLLFAAGRQKKTEIQVMNRCLSKSLHHSSLPFMGNNVGITPLEAQWARFHSGSCKVPLWKEELVPPLHLFCSSHGRHTGERTSSACSQVLATFHEF